MPFSIYVYFTYIVAASAAIHAFLKILTQVLYKILPAIILVIRMIGSEREMNSVTMTIINPRTEIGRAMD